MKLRALRNVPTEENKKRKNVHRREKERMKPIKSNFNDWENFKTSQVKIKGIKPFFLKRKTQKGVIARSEKS